MQTAHPHPHWHADSTDYRHALGKLGWAMAVIFALGASLAVALHYLNGGLDALLPDLTHQTAVAATRSAAPNAAASAVPMPNNFSAQFPQPDGPVEPNAPTF